MPLNFRAVGWRRRGSSLLARSRNLMLSVSAAVVLIGKSRDLLALNQVVLRPQSSLNSY